MHLHECRCIMNKLKFLSLKIPTPFLADKRKLVKKTKFQRAKSNVKHKMISWNVKNMKYFRKFLQQAELLRKYSCQRTFSIVTIQFNNRTLNKSMTALQKLRLQLYFQESLA